jgi:hypothetical protein
MREKGEVAARLIDVMQDGIGGTAMELATRIRADAKSVRGVLRRWLEAGIVHVAEDDAPRRARVFRYGGATPSAAMLPVAQPVKLRKASGIPIDHWPQLDPELAAVVDAMVRVDKRAPARGR